MKSFNLISVCVLFFISSNVFGQLTHQNHNPKITPSDAHSYIKHENKYNRILEYPFIREDDILWVKSYLQRIDLREKKNHPLYFPLYPVDEGRGIQRKNLYTILIESLRSGDLTAYEDQSFQTVKSLDQIEKTLFSIDTIEYEDPGTFEWVTRIDTQKVGPDQFKEFLIYEDRFFDKKRSVLETRIVGICPIVELYDDNTGQLEKEKLFWIWYPQARRILANSPIYSEFTPSAKLSYDEFFLKRMFSSVITKESNLYDRSISDYKKGMHQLLEADLIKQDIRSFESDLWEY